MKIKGVKKRKTRPKGKAGDVLAGWVMPLFAYDGDDRLVHCSLPPLLVAVEEKGKYGMCIICRQKVSFNKYS